MTTRAGNRLTAPHKDSLLTVRRFGLWLLVTAAIMPVSLSFFGIDPFLIFFLSLLCLPTILFASFLWVQPGATRRIRLQKSALVLLGLMVIISVPFTNWPLQLSFRISEAALNRLADKEEAKMSLPCPSTVDELFSRVFRGERTGLFFIREVRQDKAGQTCLWLGEDAFGNHIGFVRARENNTPIHWDIDTEIILNNKWYFVAED